MNNEVVDFEKIKLAAVTVWVDIFFCTGLLYKIDSVISLCKGKDFQELP